MTRRRLFSLPLLQAFLRRAANAEEKFPGVVYRDYPGCVPDFYSSLAARAYNLRNAELHKLTDTPAIRARQQWVRDTFWSVAGGRPPRTPLNVRKLGSFERTGYRVEKLLYESQPNFHIPANLYIPLAFQPPFPGVLFQMGHTRDGKAGDTYQSCCQALAQLGYLVLAFDPMGQGERVFYPAVDGLRTRLRGPGAEHDTAGKQMLLTGDTCTRLQVWDAVRSLDYLAAHPLIDPHRIASTGHSGGGTLTMLLAAADDRLAAAAVCMGNTENVACANFISPGATDDAEQNLLGSARLGFDRWDLLYPLAPKPLWIGVSDVDAYGTYSPNYIPNGWEEFQKLHAVYKTLGQANHLAWYSSPLPHALGFDSRMQIYNFFARWLKGDMRPVEKEPPVNPEPDATLWVAESGNVVRTFGGHTPHTLNKSRQVPREPASLADLLAVERPALNAPATKLGRVTTSRGVTVELIEVSSTAHVHLPAWLFRPPVQAMEKSRPVIIALEPMGRNTRWREGELYSELALAGCVVCVPDLRCIGDVAPRNGPGYPPYAREHQGEEDYTWGSLILGKPLLGQRVTDILAWVAALGQLTAPALFAAALDPAIDELYLAAPVLSYRDIVETENYTTPFACFLPGVLLHTDLPDVAASLAPRPVSLAGTVNAAGVTADPAAVRKVYGNGRYLKVLAEARWDFDNLLG